MADRIVANPLTGIEEKWYDSGDGDGSLVLGVKVVNGVVVKTFNLNLSQVAGTYTFATAGGGNIDIVGIEFYNDVAATGLTSMHADTDDTTPVALLGSTAVGALTGGKNLTAFATPTILASGKHLQYTIVGTGTAGSIKATVRYYPVSAGSSLS